MDAVIDNLCHRNSFYTCFMVMASGTLPVVRSAVGVRAKVEVFLKKELWRGSQLIRVGSILRILKMRFVGYSYRRVDMDALCMNVSLSMLRLFRCTESYSDRWGRYSTPRATA